jgi:hypothetical protein
MSYPGNVKKLDESYYDSLVFTEKTNCPHCDAGFFETHITQQGDVERHYTMEGDFFHTFKEIRACKSCKKDFASTDGF